jgi:putative FmdB family regulatory protein
MPIYAYKCASCGHAKDVLQKMSDPQLTVCPACGAATFNKQVTAAGFQLKGSGWYATDFKGGAPATAPAADGEPAKAPAEGTKPATDGAPKTATETAAKPAVSPAPAPAASKSEAPKAAAGSGPSRSRD